MRSNFRTGCERIDREENGRQKKKKGQALRQWSRPTERGYVWDFKSKPLYIRLCPPREVEDYAQG